MDGAAAVPSGGAMYGFLLRPRWIAFHLVVIAAIVAMINLGFWQLRRLDERQAFNAAVTARIDEAPLPLDELLPPDAEVGDDALDELEWRPVVVSGEYVPDEEVRVTNRSQGGAAGENVATPLELSDGRVVLVVRGFVPFGADAAAAPDGEVEVVGPLRPSQERRRGQLSDPADGELDVVQRVDIPRLAEQLPGDVVPMYVELTASDPSEPGPYPVAVAGPELGEGPHLSYAVQWLIFSLCVAVGWVLAVRRSIGQRRRTPANRPPDPS